jgi:GNAT superfamily N-acetyltransferase
MDRQFVYELVGYAASVLVAISLTMSSILRLRVINLAGSLAFTAYGLAIHAYPVAAVNGFIVLINLYYLRRMLGTREYFRLLSVEPDSEYLRYFLGFYDREIRRFLPEFSYAPSPRQVTLFILRDLVPAGLFIGKVEPGGVLRVKLDFVIPSYRDFKIGRYLFGEGAALFRGRGCRHLVSGAGNPEHAAYLRRVGFAPRTGDDGADEYRLDLGEGPPASPVAAAHGA